MPFTITVVSVSDGSLKFLSEAVLNFKSNEKTGYLFENKIKINMHFIGESRDHIEKLSVIKQDIHSSAIIIFDMMGSDLIFSGEVDTIVADYKGDLILPGYGSAYLRSRARLGSFNLGKMIKMMEPDKKGHAPDFFDMEKMIKRAETIGKLLPVGPLKDMRNMLLVGNYWRYACLENIKNMLLLLCRDYGKIKKLDKPGPCIDFSKYVLFDPETIRGFATLAELKKEWGWNNHLPSIGLFFYHFNYPNYTFSVFSQIIKQLRERYNVVPFGMGFGSDKFKKINRIIDEGLSIDLVWDFLPFRFGESPMGGNKENGLAVFRRLNCPVMHPFFLSMCDINDWENGASGLNPMETIVNVMLPELDGVCDTLPIAGLHDKKDGIIENLKELRIIDHRMKKMIDRSDGYLKLKRKKNSEKKIAIILYNYPPGEANIGEGAYLDTFKSVERIVSNLKKEDFICEPVTSEDLEQIFMGKGVSNTPQWSDGSNIKISYPVHRYMPEDAASLDGVMVERVSKKWGKVPGKIMNEKQTFLIPGSISGNIFIGLQPSRGLFEDKEKMYHDKDLPPHHQYLAFYQWLEKEFMADAVVHVGTHGTLEFLPGKEVGLSETCYPDYIIGSMPHFYLYYTGNPSEATIAKRRGYANITSYSGPPFKRSGAYGDYLKIEDLINEYMEAEHLLPQKQSELLEKIKIGVQDLKLAVDDDYSIDNIADEIIRLKSSLIPAGLHEFGKDFTLEEKICFISSILSWDRGDVDSLYSIIRDVFEDLILLEDNKIKSKTALAREEAVNETAGRIIKDFFFEDKKYFKHCLNKISRQDRKRLSKTMQFGQICLDRLQQTDEIQGLLNSLKGNYTDARLGGDYIRDPEVFPTGYNLYQFDPRLIPSDTAMERGKKIAESTIEKYLEEEGKYPESISVVLWGLETSKTKGETIGQIFTYLGLKIIKGLDVSENRIEVIPVSELKRPRIDCLITICGFFRDMFPLLLEFLDEACETAAMLDEPDEINFIRKNSRLIYNELKKDVDEKNAKEFSLARIFGPPQGEYGTRLTDMIESTNWNKETEIAKAYMSSHRHVYTRRRKGESCLNAFEYNLKHVDLVSQVRSSSDYTITDLDHYYEFFGGLAKSVETVRGAAPKMLFTDSSTEVIYTDDAKKAIESGLRTRLFNPEYINGMLNHKVHGAQQISKQVTNLIGLAATTSNVESWIFDDVKHTFIDDPEIYEKLKENNRFAALDIIKRLLEAQKRGYWETDKENLQELIDIYMELEGDIEEACVED